MPENINVRWGWLKFMYLYAIVGAGGFGLGLIFIPDVIKTALNAPSQEPVVLGITCSVYLAFAILSILGLRSPLKFVPVLLLQLCYKSIWFIFIFLPLLVRGQLSTYVILTALIYATYIIGDLIAIPFSCIFVKQSEQ